MRWTVLIPMRALPSAKSRLRSATAGAADHANLVDAIRNDTLAAVAAAAPTARIVLAVDQPWTATDIEHETFVQRGAGLNPAMAQAQVWAVERWPDDAVAALVGDLPALRPADIAAALESAAAHDHAYFADMWETGTTLLTARPGCGLRPAFGPDSARAHARFATALTGRPGLRCDVDTPEDLDAAVALGVGPRTTAFLAGATILREATGR